ncbi:MAG: NADH-quinone oxidoreductase subunit H [Thermosphaera sp.]
MIEYVALAIMSITLLILPIMLDGWERKLKAIVQSRVGPPLTQTLYDLLKLLGKEVKPFPGSTLALYTIINTILLQATALVFLNYFIMIRADFTIFFTGVALFIVAQASNIITPLLVPNPFSQVGGYREVILSLINEFTMILSVGVISYIVNNVSLSFFGIVGLSSALITLLITSYVSTGRPPFDIAEAEVELASGVLVEFSGPLLATYVYSILMRRLLAKIIPISLIIGVLLNSNLLSSIVSILLLIIVWSLYALVSFTLGRSRIDIAPYSLLKLYIPLLTISITGLLIGAYYV